MSSWAKRTRKTTIFQTNISPVCQHTDKSPILREEIYIQQLIFNIAVLGTERILDESAQSEC